LPVYQETVSEGQNQDIAIENRMISGFSEMQATSQKIEMNFEYKAY
jgi:hypothetical protein